MSEDKRRQYICKTCKKEFVKTDNITNDIAKIIQYGECGTCFDRSCNIEEWQNKQYDEPNIVCPWCRYTYESHENLYEEGKYSITCHKCNKEIECEAEVK